MAVLALFSIPVFVAACAPTPPATPAPTAATLPLPPQLAGDHIFVSDLLTGNVAELGAITTHAAQSVHGLGLSPDGHTLFVTDVASNRLLGYALNGGALGAARSVGVGRQPVHMVETLDAKTLYVSDYSEQSISVVDVATWTLRATITVPAAPHSIVLSPDGRWVYAACYGGHAIAVIDAAQATLVATIPLPNTAQPYGLAISKDGRALYASDNLTGRLFVVETATRQIATTVQVGLHPALLARSEDGTALYVANGGSHSVSALDLAADPLRPTLRATIPVDGYPHGIAVTPDGHYVVVANTFGRNLSVIDTRTLKVIATIPGEKYPNDVLITR